MADRPRPRLLVVDDNKVNRLLLARTLELQGHSVGDGGERPLALERLRAGALRPGAARHGDAGDGRVRGAEGDGAIARCATCPSSSRRRSRASTASCAASSSVRRTTCQAGEPGAAPSTARREHSRRSVARRAGGDHAPFRAAGVAEDLEHRGSPSAAPTSRSGSCSATSAVSRRCATDAEDTIELLNNYYVDVRAISDERWLDGG